MAAAAQPHDPLDDLITDKWTLSIDGTQYIAFRPFGWTGSDPHERESADTREALLAKLRYRARREESPW